MTLMRTLLLFTAFLATAQLAVWDAQRLLEHAAHSDHQLTQSDPSAHTVILLDQQEQPEYDLAFVPVSWTTAKATGQESQTVTYAPELVTQYDHTSIRGPPTA